MKFVWDGAHIIAEYEFGSLTKKYIYGPGIDEPVVMINVDWSGEDWYYYYPDALGSIRLMTDAAGLPVESYTYDVFGRPRVMTSGGTDGNWLTEDVTTQAASEIGNPYMFTGRRYDSDTGLYYYRFRDYAPELGRFCQTDPLGYIDTMNIYAYCGNNSVNWIDPWGLDKETPSIKPIDAEPILKEGRDTPYNPFKHAGEWDFSYNDHMGDSFQLSDGSILSDSEFGNYMAGYMGGYHLGDFGYLAMRGMGNIYENDKQGKFPNPFSGDDPDSIRDINRGYEDGVEDKYQEYQDTWKAIKGLFN